MSVPKTYGSSLYDLAKEEGIAKEVFSELKDISVIFKNHPDYVKILDAPQIDRDELMEILNEDFFDKVNHYVLNFLKLLCEKHMVHHFDECFKTYVENYNRDNNIKVVNVTTAKPMGKIIEDKLIKKLEEKTGGTVVLNKRVDERCIGGIIIEIDGMRIDSSVKTGLDELKKALI